MKKLLLSLGLLTAIQSFCVTDNQKIALLLTSEVAFPIVNTALSAATSKRSGKISALEHVVRDVKNIATIALLAKLANKETTSQAASIGTNIVNGVFAAGCLYSLYDRYKQFLIDKERLFKNLREDKQTRQQLAQREEVLNRREGEINRIANQITIMSTQEKAIIHTEYNHPRPIATDEHCYICFETVKNLQEKTKQLLCCGAVICQDCINNPETATCGTCNKIIKAYIQPKIIRDAATDTYDA